MLLVLRNGERVHARAGPREARRETSTASASSSAQSLSAFVESWQESVTLTARLTGEIGRSLANIVHEEGREQIASPIGIVDESSSAARRGWESYLAVLAFISLSLGLLNLLPLLPLDGGHIVFALAEKVRGHAIRREIYERVSAVGIARRAAALLRRPHAMMLGR